MGSHKGRRGRRARPPPGGTTVQPLREFSLQTRCSCSGASSSLQFIVAERATGGATSAQSQRRREQGGDGEGVEQDQLVTNFQMLPDGFEPVAVEAGRE